VQRIGIDWVWPVKVIAHPRAPRRRLIGVAVVLLALAVPSSALASKLHLLVPRVTSFASDGGSYVAWQTSKTSAVTVLDTSTGRSRTIAIPSGCQLVNETGDGFRGAISGRFLVECGSNEKPEGKVIDAVSGQSSALPGGARWFALGSRYAFGVGTPESYVVADPPLGT
jgi:hypothetical protein